MSMLNLTYSASQNPSRLHTGFLPAAITTLTRGRGTLKSSRKPPNRGRGITKLGFHGKHVLPRKAAFLETSGVRHEQHKSWEVLTTHFCQPPAALWGTRHPGQGSLSTCGGPSQWGSGLPASEPLPGLSCCSEPLISPEGDAQLLASPGEG